MSAYCVRPASPVTIADVVGQVAFEAEVSSKRIVTEQRATGMFRELRAAVVWCATACTHRSLAAIAAALGRAAPTGRALLGHAELLREVDPEFRQLTDTVVTCLRAAHPVLA